MSFILSPSILAADFKILGEQLRLLSEGGAQYVHVDVMDGLFVPSISFGMPVIKSIRTATDRFFDVHLMIENPQRYIGRFKECGADSLTVHYEAVEDMDATLDMIHSLGIKSGIAISPKTPVSVLYPYFGKTDMFLIMTVEPGFGGQKYIEASTDKIKTLRNALTVQGYDTHVEVDGGITRENIRTVLDAGADVIVMGSSVFKGSIADNLKYFSSVSD